MSLINRLIILPPSRVYENIRRLVFYSMGICFFKICRAYMCTVYYESPCLFLRGCAVDMIVEQIKRRKLTRGQQQ